MRLQGAIFTIEDTLGEGAEKVLSILKMEGVWLYAVSALERDAAERLLRERGAEDCFRGLLTVRETGCRLDSGALYERALHRLRTLPRFAMVFTGSLAALRGAKSAGLRVAAVRDAAAPEDWAVMRGEADELVERWADYLEAQ